MQTLQVVYESSVSTFQVGCRKKMKWKIMEIWNEKQLNSINQN